MTKNRVRLDVYEDGIDFLEHPFSTMLLVFLDKISVLFAARLVSYFSKEMYQTLAS